MRAARKGKIVFPLENPAVGLATTKFKNGAVSLSTSIRLHRVFFDSAKLLSRIPYRSSFLCPKLLTRMSLADKVKPRQRFDNDGVVIDIGGSNISRTMKLALETRLLRPSSGARPLLPTALLYNDYGMRLWEKITHLPNYYQTATEIRLLELHAKAITCYVGPGSVLLDTGSGYDRLIRVENAIADF